MARTKQVARFRVDEHGNVVPIVRPLQSPSDRMRSDPAPVTPTIKKTKKGKKKPKEAKAAKDSSASSASDADEK
jgi:hypothetical protein